MCPCFMMSVESSTLLMHVAVVKSGPSNYLAKFEVQRIDRILILLASSPGSPIFLTLHKKRGGAL